MLAPTVTDCPEMPPGATTKRFVIVVFFAERSIEQERHMRRKVPLRSGDPVRPTAAELGILRALWRIGPATVHKVHETLEDGARIGYTTVLKLLQVMHQKGLVTRDDSQRAHIYRPVHSRDETQRVLTNQLIDGAFDGSRSQLVLHALSDTERASPDEIAEIRALLERLESAAQ